MSSPLPSFQNQRVLVQGLGRFGGGVGVTRYLVSQGAHVTVTDTAPESDLKESIAQLADLPQNQLTLKLGGHDLADFTHTDFLVTNPAVDKEKSPHVQAAKNAGVPITSEINLFLQRNPAFTIGITGSVGKSTTTALIHLALQAALQPVASSSPLETGNWKLKTPTVFLGGNIGKSLLSDLPSIRPHDIVVLELSSFMLEDTPQIQWSPNIAVVTNLFPNHLDRHHTMAEYAAAKQNILQFQSAARGDLAIFNADHDLVSRWTHLAHAKVVKYSTRGPREKWIALSIPGEHNQSNAQAALAVLENLPASYTPNRAAALAAMKNFTGLSHRLQLVCRFQTPDARTVSFYNDSKATSPDASITALHAFDPGAAVFIVGGYDKHIDMSSFTNLLAERAGGVIGVGATGQALTAATLAAAPAKASRIHYAQTLQAAVLLARQWTLQSPSLSAVVLSPASASWDQYKNYEQRGDHFATLARQDPS
jgi:UDP-N-acetylmuramoylalanine--D-glutamate ligase